MAVLCWHTRVCFSAICQHNLMICHILVLYANTGVCVCFVCVCEREGENGSLTFNKNWKKLVLSSRYKSSFSFDSKGRFPYHQHTIVEEIRVYILVGEVKESHNRPSVAQRLPGGLGSQISWHSACEGGEVVSLTHRPPVPPGMFLVIIFTRGRKEMSLKNPVTPPGINTGTVRLEAQCLNHYVTPDPNIYRSCQKHKSQSLHLSLCTACNLWVVQFVTSLKSNLWVCTNLWPYRTWKNIILEACKHKTELWLRKIYF